MKLYCFPLFPVQFDKSLISQEILFPYKMCNVVRDLMPQELDCVNELSD